MIRKTNEVPAVLVVSAVILLAVGSSAHARFTSSHAQVAHSTSVQTAPVRTPSETKFRSSGFGWGYGRGWCYWHPYSCYRAQ